MTPHKRRSVEVNDRMQQGYVYHRTEAPGRNFAPAFRPQLTPKEMLRLGVFGGRYMTDCRAEFPASWFAGARLSPAKYDALVPVAAGEGLDVSLDVNYRGKLWSRDEARAVLTPLARHASILIASDDELGLVAAAPGTGGTADDAETAMADELLDRGVREVVVKRGAAGAGVHTTAGRWETPAVPVTSIDTVGAGDAFTAGYLSALLDGEDVAGRLQRGALAGAFAVSTAGDWEGLPRRDELALLGSTPTGTTQR